jgi:hypothetical protein
VSSAGPEVDDGQREEGEISDCDEPPPAPPKKRTAPMDRTPPGKKSKKNKISADNKNISPKIAPLAPKSSAGKVEPPIKDKGKGKESLQPSEFIIPSGSSLQNAGYETPEYGLDPNHIRPGLASRFTVPTTMDG